MTTIRHRASISIVTCYWLYVQRHRVLIPEDERQRRLVRRSIVFFVVPDDDVTVQCLDGSDKYPPVNAMDYIAQLTTPTRY